MKRCSRCKQDLPATTEYFARSKPDKDGLFSYCKKCTAERRATNRGKYPLFEKKCSRCKENFRATTDYFYISRNVRTGLAAYCISCTSEDRLEYYHKYPEKHKIRKKKYIQCNKEKNANINPYKIDAVKICSDCKQEKSTIEFHRSAHRHDGLRNLCKECAQSRSKIWRDAKRNED